MSVLKMFSKEALNAAKKQVLWQSQALDLSTACLMVLNDKREVTYINAAMQRLVAANSTHFQHFFPAASDLRQSHFGHLSQMYPQINEAFLSPQDRQCCQLSSQGHVFTVTINALHDETQIINGYLVEWSDNNKAQTNNALLNAFSRAQLVTEFLPDGTIVAANELCLQSTGYSLSDLNGKPYCHLLTFQSEQHDAVWQRLLEGETLSLEVILMTKHGEARWLQASYMPVTNGVGEVIRIVQFATDITAQKREQTDFEGQITAVNKSQAVIEFALDGTILRANQQFLDVTGYAQDEIEGQHHSMFVDAQYKISPQYNAFWKALGRGEFQQGEYKRVAKDGSDIWLHAIYNTVLDENGKPFKVVKIASDITAQKAKNAYFEGQLTAINRSQAVIEFDMNGHIITANDNFLNTVGYALDDIVGKHHRMFVPETQQNSPEYKAFWDQLQAGEFVSGEFKRVGKDANVIWIQATYNPIFGIDGKPVRVVKYAVDITEQKLRNAYFEGQIEAIGKSQAVIEFNLDGTVCSANDLFLSTVGYTLEEVKGKHHSIFVDAVYRNSPEYKAFWERLGNGEHVSGEFRRIAKDGRDVFIQATYSPILDQEGKPFRVVKYATDVTARTVAIEKVKAVMARMAAGDMTSEVNVTLDGEFQALGESVNQFVEQMRSVIGSINEAVETINTASHEIATGNADLSSRTEQQASSLEETASSMEELTGTVRLNAENAEQANGLAAQACSVAGEGGELIQQVVTTMSEINDSAQEIADIIGVIDGIAFQTNILALNAAVEAARAGEQGRGFAVVASEVRTLAQRSAEAAKDIKALISDSVGKITNGNKLVSRSGETMGEVVVAVKRVNDIMSEIAAASAEQASGIEEVSKAVVQMDEMTQQNAALVEEAAAAADSLRHQSSQLADQVSQFNVSDAMPKPTRSSTLVPPPVRTATKEAREILPAPSFRTVKAASPQDEEWEAF